MKPKPFASLNHFTVPVMRDMVLFLSVVLLKNVARSRVMLVSLSSRRSLGETNWSPEI
jgi:hypothetical protein